MLININTNINTTNARGNYQHLAIVVMKKKQQILGESRETMTVTI